MPPSERIAVFAALRWECRPVLHHLRRVHRRSVADFSVWQGEAGGTEVWLVKTGMGTERAAAAATAVAAASAFDVFISTGCAGALRPELTAGDLAIATVMICAAHRFETAPQQRLRAHSAAARGGLRTTLGPVLCSPTVLATAAAKQAAALDCGAVAVEMEGGGIAAAAERAGIPFISVRTILDDLGIDLAAPGPFIDPQRGTLKPWALFRSVASSPSALAGLRPLLRMATPAQAGLQKFFGALLSG